jgi:hypothetical protein
MRNCKTASAENDFISTRLPVNWKERAHSPSGAAMAIQTNPTG